MSVEPARRLLLPIPPGPVRRKVQEPAQGGGFMKGPKDDPRRRASMCYDYYRSIEDNTGGRFLPFSLRPAVRQTILHSWPVTASEGESVVMG
ncbi:plasmid stability protein [Anopheles sinensis]|uniref:Plasmid stability protein n=1 Tax=Anopheles sinensis TaxID=74873 RepID=A0A084WSQ5_ANOSI|nr:plasmid stability protein [Anopheles sinensis]